MTVKSISDFEPQAVIIDAGSYPTHPEALRWLSVTDRIVCCDGAANRYLSSPNKVWRIVGDCDSLSPQIMESYRDLIRRFPDQETNDQTKAVRYIRSHGMNRIVILGATGLREDHTLGNLSLLTDYLKEGVEARAYTDFGVFIPVLGNTELICRRGQQISIFNFGASGLSADGLRYPLRDFDNLWQGTLNEAVASRVIIRADGYLLLFINY